MDNSRKICIKCGRKRYTSAMISAYWSHAKSSYNSKWRSYPRRDSYICIENCQTYKP